MGDLFHAGGGNTTKMYDIPLGQFEMSYIESATDVKELEKMLKVLRSGSEGSFPHLEVAIEKRLAHLDPECRALRKEQRVKQASELPGESKGEIDQFLQDIAQVDQELKKKTKSKPKVNGETPPIRGAGKISKGDKNKGSSPMPKSHREWDKVNWDAELEKETNDEKLTSKRQASIATEVDVTGKSEIEKQRIAEMDKDKGNEYFTSGDYDTAIVYYTRSISVISSPASHNNRALAYLKRELYSRCIDDCQVVLNQEPNNIKALLRRGSAYKAQCEYTKAKRDFSRVLELEPQNLRAEKLFKETENAWRTKGKKLKIDDVDGSDGEVNGESESTEPKVNGDLVNGGEAEIPTTVTNFSPTAPTDPYPEKSEPMMTKTNSAPTKSEPAPAKSEPKPKGRRVAIEESDSEDSGAESEKENIKPVSAQVDETPSTSSDAASVKTASTDVSSDSDQAVYVDASENVGTDEESQESPLHKPKPQRPMFRQNALSKDLSDLKDEGNTYFRSGQYGKALDLYSRIIDKLNVCDDDSQIVNLTTLYTNRATAHFKLGDCKSAIDDCSASLKLIPHNVKALLRRGLAYEALEKYKQAYVDFKHTLSIDGGIDSAQQGLNRCRGMLYQQYGKSWRSHVEEVVVNPYDIPLIIPESGIIPEQPPPLEPVPAKIESVAPKAESKPKAEKSEKPAMRTDEPKNESKAEKLQESKVKVTEPKESPEETKEKTKLKDEAQHETLKSQGNNFVHKSQFDQAISCYTQCLKIFKDRSAVYTNRALCYLRTNQSQNAINDCDKAIQLEETNLKAWFRRAQAKKMKKDYRGSMQDLLQVLRLDSTNSAAKKELEEVKKLYKTALDEGSIAGSEKPSETPKTEETSKKKKKKKKPVIEVLSETNATPNTEVKPETKKNEKTKTEIKTKKETKPKTEVNVEAKEEAKPKAEVKSKEGMKPRTKEETKPKANEETKPQAKEETKPKTKQETKLQVKEETKPKPKCEPQPSKNTTQPTVTPKLEKLTPYEFMNAWHSLKGSKDIAPYAKLMDQIQPSQLSTILGNKLDSEILTTILRSIHEYTMETDLSRAYQLLHHLRHVERFDMATMFMSNLDKVNVRHVLDRLSTDSKCTKNELSSLKKAFKV